MGLHLGNLSEPTFEAGLIQRLGSLTDKRVLELGCGLAPHARLLSDFTQYYVAIDISWRKLADCRILGKVIRDISFVVMESPFHFLTIVLIALY